MEGPLQVTPPFAPSSFLALSRPETLLDSFSSINVKMRRDPVNHHSVTIRTPPASLRFSSSFNPFFSLSLSPKSFASHVMLSVYRLCNFFHSLLCQPAQFRSFYYTRLLFLFVSRPLHRCCCNSLYLTKFFCEFYLLSRCHSLLKR